MAAFFQISVIGLQVNVPNRSDVQPAFADLLEKYRDTGDEAYLDDMIALSKTCPTDYSIPVIVLPLLVKADQLARALEFGKEIAAHEHNNPLMPIVFGEVLQRSGESDFAERTLIRGFCLRLGVQTGLPPDETRDALFIEALKAVCEADTQMLSDPMLLSAGAALGRSNYFEGILDRLTRIEHFSFLDGGPLAASVQITAAYDLALFLGLSTSPSVAWRTALLDWLIIPVMTRLRSHQLFDELLRLENMVYFAYVRFEETEEHYRAYYKKVRPILEGAGLDFAEQRPFYKTSTPKADGGPRKVGVIINNHAWLAHVIVILEIIECIQASNPDAFEFHIFAISSSASERLIHRCEELGVTVWDIQDRVEREKVSESLLTIRSLCQEIGIDVTIWTSVAIYCYFAYAFRVAPVQIYFSMKYKTIAPTHADGLLALHSIAEPVKRYGDVEWRMGRMYLTDLYDESLAEQAGKVRAKYNQFRTILGCIGRDDKINSPQFLAVVVQLLRDNPDAVFLWTGAGANPSILAHFRQAGVLEQTAFVGWVDTKVYAQVLDVFLDSFPFPCGRTAFEAMVAETPVVFFRSDEAFSTGIIMTVDPLLNGGLGEKKDQDLIKDIFADQSDRTLMPIADTAEEYRQFVQDLIDDRDLRDRTGNAQGRFVKAFMCNKPETGRIYSRHITDIIMHNA